MVTAPTQACPPAGPECHPDLEGNEEMIVIGVAQIAREPVVRIRDLTATISDLEREISWLVAELAPALLALTGCGSLTAAKLVGETEGIGRFRSAAAFARHKLHRLRSGRATVNTIG